MVICLGAVTGWTFGWVIRIDVMEFFICWEHPVDELVQSRFVHFALFFQCPFVGFPADCIGGLVVPLFALDHMLTQGECEECVLKCNGFFACDWLAIDVKHGFD